MELSKILLIKGHPYVLKRGIHPLNPNSLVLWNNLIQNNDVFKVIEFGRKIKTLRTNVAIRLEITFPATQPQDYIFVEKPFCSISTDPCKKILGISMDKKSFNIDLEEGLKLFWLIKRAYDEITNL